jgi:UDP-glucose 4-epimerase
MATVVITGAAGFLGRFVTACLVRIGLTVIPVSRRPFPGTYQVQDYSQSPSGDVLIHLAEEADRSKVNRLGQSYLSAAANLTKALSAGRYLRTIYASSGAVYGDQVECPCKVGMPVYATDIYSNSKLMNERIILDSGGVVIRLSNLIGIGMASSNVMSDIIHQIPGNGPLCVRDDKPVRDFLPVSDAAAAFGLMAESNFRGIANVGSGIGTSVKALAELSLASAGQETREIIATAPSSRRSINVLDISETTEILGWSPATTLKDQVVQFFAKEQN